MGSEKNFRGVRIWALPINNVGGEFRLYYSVSTFGSNQSVIGLTTNKTLNPSSPDYKWIDQGLVFASTKQDDFNAIDPNLAVDANGDMWMSFGSFWSGIKMRKLDVRTGKLSSDDTALYSLASRPRTAELKAEIEAPFIVRNGNYYYLFVSYDRCCRGAQSTYKIMVGRSDKITGPYLDKTGKPMMDGGATLLLEGNGQQGPLRARIKIDTERVIGDIDPKIYGNFIEHLGRCIDGGIFEEKSPLSDANGFRQDVLDAAKKLNVTQLRWPGGNFSSNYHWKDGIGPRDKRPPRLEMAWGTVESNRFGTHEFLEYAEMLGTEPYICANLGTGHLGRRRSSGWSTVNSSRGHGHDAAAQSRTAGRPVEGDLLGPGQRDGRALADGPSQRRGLRQVRARSGQADEVDRPEHQADRGGIVQLRPGHRLDRLEPHGARVPEAARRLPCDPHVCW